ncbi:MAG: class I SAM-dependent methyltransferase [Candidatus Izemoplasmatales bacterium]
MMFTKQDVVQFFDEAAPTWDQNEINQSEVINIILDHAFVADKNVLDVACGTGVLFSYYASRNCSVTALDISSEMVKIAKEKVKSSSIQVIHNSFEDYESQELFDIVMIFNAFPHFTDYQQTIKKALSLTKKNGMVSIAHSYSKKQIDDIHHRKANKISQLLPNTSDLIAMFPKSATLVYEISNDIMYQVVFRN